LIGYSLGIDYHNSIILNLDFYIQESKLFPNVSPIGLAITMIAGILAYIAFLTG